MDIKHNINGHIGTRRLNDNGSEQERTKVAITITGILLTMVAFVGLLSHITSLL